MTNLSQKFARIFLLFYCLTPLTYTKCENNYEKKVTRRSPPPTTSMTGIFAEIERIETENTKSKTKGDQNKHPSIVCGAAWIGTNFLITAASCLETVFLLPSGPPKHKKTKTPKPQTTTPEILMQPKLTLDVKAKMQRTYDVNVILMVKKENQGYIRNDSQPLKGKAKIHPHFQRSLYKVSEGMPIAFDVAVVKADSENHGIGSLCKPKESRETKWSLIAIKPGEDGTVYEQSLEQFALYPQKDVGIFISKKVVISPNHQFTTYSKDLEDEALIAGLPILTGKGAPIRCIAGISNFYGHEEGEKDMAYITSTNVSTLSIQKWIEYAKDELKTQKKRPKKGEGYSEKFWEEENKNVPIRLLIGTERIIKIAGGTSMKMGYRAGFPVDEIHEFLS